MRIISIFITSLLLILVNSAIKFGKYHPNGFQAVTYMYSSDGFWKPLTNLVYGLEKYSSNGSPQHILNSYEFDKLVQKGQSLTCRDEEGHILGDLDLDGELDVN